MQTAFVYKPFHRSLPNKTQRNQRAFMHLYTACVLNEPIGSMVAFYDASHFYYLFRDRHLHAQKKSHIQCE